MICGLFCRASQEISYKKLTNVCKVYIRPHCRLSLVPPNFMKFGIWSQHIGIITFVKFLVNRFRGCGVLTPPKLPFPIDLLLRPYNSVRTAMRHCDEVLTNWSAWLVSAHSTWSTSWLNVLILTILGTNILLLPLWRKCLKLLTYVMFLILSKKLIFITNCDVVNFFDIYVTLILLYCF